MTTDGSPVRALIVDDEVVVRTGIARVLAGQGLEVHMAGDGEEALQMMEEQSYSVVFLDIKMPKLDGFSVLKHIRAVYPKTIVVMVTGYPTIDSAIECLKLGAVDYLVKPFRVDELEALLVQAIERILILEDGDIIAPEHLPAFITQRQGEFRVFSEEVFTLEELERRYIQFILRRTKGKRQEAADILGINRKTLGMKIARYGIHAPWFCIATHSVWYRSTDSDTTLHVALLLRFNHHV